MAIFVSSFETKHLNPKRQLYKSNCNLFILAVEKKHLFYKKSTTAGSIRIAEINFQSHDRINTVGKERRDQMASRSSVIRLGKQNQAT